MKHRKILSTVLLICLMLTLFSACTNNSNNNENDDYENGNLGENENQSNENQGSENQGGNNSNNKNEGSDDESAADEKISITTIESNYSEGLAFVKTDDDSPLYCIDKSGKTVFTVDASYVGSGFHNGLTLLMQKEPVLCDKTGKIITAQDLGGDSLVCDNLEIFNDGFILVKKTTTSYKGSVDEIAVFNSKLEKIVDFSSELYTAFIEDYNYNGTCYYNGYLFDRTITESVLDLRTGKISTNLSEWVKTIELKNDYDFWRAGNHWNGQFTPANDEEYFIYDFRDELSSTEYYPTVTPVIDLSEYENVSVISQGYFGSGFVDDVAALSFEVYDSEVGRRYYFTIMDKNGEFLFEPIETQGMVSSLKYDDGFFVLNTSKYYIEVYNKSGKVASMKYEEPSSFIWNITYDINDGIIYVSLTSYSNHNEDWAEFYTTDLKPLF